MILDTKDRAKSMLSSPLRRRKDGDGVDGNIEGSGLLIPPPRRFRLRNGSLGFGSIKAISVIVLLALAIISFGTSGNLQPPSLTSAFSPPEQNNLSPPPTFLRDALDSCEAAKNEHGEYPFMFEKIVVGRNEQWRKEQQKYNFLKSINDKLGGYMYATKHGVRTPRILFCGKAKDIPRSTNLFGNNYVIKPLKRHSAQGVRVIRNGLDIMKMKNERVSYDMLTKAYDEDETEILVEELIGSANPKYDGLIPPDYKFFVYGGGKIELLWIIDRNMKPECSNFFDLSLSNKNWSFLEDVIGGYPRPCSNDARKAILEDAPRQRRKLMEDAAQTLADSIGPNWMRIDMYDSTHGPVLGEFTPFSGNGKGEPFFKCVMSYLFIAHAEHGAPNDDSDLISKSLLNDANEFKARSRMKNRAKHSNNGTFDFYPPEAREWLEFDEMTKCKKVMAAQH